MKFVLETSNLKYYRLPVFITVVFIIECFALNAHKWFTPEYEVSDFIQERLDSTDDPVTKALIIENIEWAIEKETKERFIYGYLIFGGFYFLIFMKCRFYPDWIDECFSGLWIISCVIDFMDRLQNWNVGNIVIDFWGFGFVFLLLFFIKYKHYPLIKFRL